MAKDALGAHARDELGITAGTTAKPIQAALTSALTFSAGAALPLAAAMLAPLPLVTPVVFAASIAYLGALGALGAWVGKAPMAKAVARVLLWGAAAMAVTAAVGKAFGVAV